MSLLTFHLLSIHHLQRTLQSKTDLRQFGASRFEFDGWYFDGHYEVTYSSEEVLDFLFSCWYRLGFIYLPQIRGNDYTFFLIASNYVTKSTLCNDAPFRYGKTFETCNWRGRAVSADFMASERVTPMAKLIYGDWRERSRNRRNGT